MCVCERDWFCDLAIQRVEMWKIVGINDPVTQRMTGPVVTQNLISLLFVCGRITDYISERVTEQLFPMLLLESVVNFSGRDVFSNEEFDHNALFHAPRYLLFAHHSIATPRQDWTGSNPSRREGGGCVFTLSRSHSCCAVRFFTHKSVLVIFEPPCTW